MYLDNFPKFKSYLLEVVKFMGQEPDAIYNMAEYGYWYNCFDADLEPEKAVENYADHIVLLNSDNAPM